MEREFGAQSAIYGGGLVCLFVSVLLLESKAQEEDSAPFR